MRTMAWTVCILGLLGCGHEAGVFKPAKTETGHLSPAVSRAKLVWADDFDVLILAGGELLGTLQYPKGTKAPTRAMDRKAADDAAGLGGTHIVRLADGTKKSANYALTDDTVVPVATHLDYPLYAVVRVTSDRWEALPPALQPQEATGAAPNP